MKKMLALLVLMACLFTCIPVQAADVSGYEAHATIDLTPFKGDNYSGTFDEISYEATIESANWIEMRLVGSTYDYYDAYFRFYPQIEMTALMGVEFFSPSLCFSTSDYSSVGGFYCVIGENRYLLEAEMDSTGKLTCFGHISIGKSLYSVLKEIANTTYPVTFCVASHNIATYSLTPDDIAIIKQFVDDLDASGLAEQLGDEDNVVIITQYN